MAGRNHPERNAAEGRAGAAKERQGAVGQRGAGTSEGRDEKTEGLRKKKELEGLIALVKEFQGAYNATKEQQEKYKISIEKVPKAERSLPETVSEFSGRAGRAPGAGTERGLPMPGMWFFRASASGNTSQRTGCGSGNPGQRETKNWTDWRMTQIRRVWKQENEKNARKHYGIRSRGRHKSFYMRRNGKS